MKHYSKEELELYRNHQMSVLKRIVCAGHLNECRICSSRLKELETDDHFLNDLRSSIRIFQEVQKKNVFQDSLEKKQEHSSPIIPSK